MKSRASWHRFRVAMEALIELPAGAVTIGDLLDIIEIREDIANHHVWSDERAKYAERLENILKRAGSTSVAEGHATTTKEI